MDPITASLAVAGIGSAADLIGGIMTNNQSAANLNTANQFSAQQFATRYQTTVKDLEAAGLNPMLAYGATPSPPSSAGVAQVQNPAKGLGTTALSAAQTLGDLKLKDEQAKTVSDQGVEAVSRTTLNEKNAQYIDAQTASEIMRMPGIPEDVKIKAATAKLIPQQEKTAAAQEDYYRNQSRGSGYQADILEPDARMARTPYGQLRPYGKDAGAIFHSAVEARTGLRSRVPPNSTTSSYSMDPRGNVTNNWSSTSYER
jgi:hypothetical protein